MNAPVRRPFAPRPLFAAVAAAGLLLVVGAPSDPFAHAVAGAAARPAGLDPGYAVVEPDTALGADVRDGRTLTSAVLLHLVDEATNAAQGYTGVTHVNVTCWARGASVRTGRVQDRRYLRSAGNVWYRLLAPEQGHVAWVPAARTKYLGDLRVSACRPVLAK
jgi:hypothetical protein